MYYLAPGQTQPRKLVQGLQPALSPDSKKLAYVQAGEGKGLMVLDRASGRSTTLVSLGPERIDGPAWSPQGHLSPQACPAGILQVREGRDISRHRLG